MDLFLTRFRELRQRLDIAIICIRKRIMCVQRQEFPELSVDNPSNRPIRVLAFDPEDGFVAIERVQAVADPDPESMEKNGYTAMTFLVPFEPEFEHKRGEATTDEFIRDIYAVLGDRARTPCL